MPATSGAEDVIILGAGIVGLSVAIHLRRRGRPVLVLDRAPERPETSFGNAGIIQTECVRPYAFPREAAMLWRIARRLSPRVDYDMGGLLSSAPALVRYWSHSAPDRFERIVEEYAALIAPADPEHEDLAREAGCVALLLRNGWIKFYRSDAALRTGSADADARLGRFGIRHEKLDAGALRRLEPAFVGPVAGAIHWVDALTVSDTGALLAALRNLLVSLGGRIATGDAAEARRDGYGWSVRTGEGGFTSRDLVVALGPWSGTFLRGLGYRVPLILTFPGEDFERRYSRPGPSMLVRETDHRATRSHDGTLPAARRTMAKRRATFIRVMDQASYRHSIGGDAR